MNDKSQRFINDTIKQLDLDEVLAKYLKSSMEMLYIMAQRDQLEKDHKATMEIIGGIGKK